MSKVVGGGKRDLQVQCGVWNLQVQAKEIAAHKANQTQRISRIASTHHDQRAPGESTGGRVSKL